ncbi:hypothetical protein DY218_22300 [Streptomyces triticagri]|uniref:Condensation domain-containing protein n=1 Tax=Streptomyces triticagri TaxID=2293568 RepID=A0A372M2A6_9ACTN|nr:hypothetical protein DY218_22300 [Streptomyces triticagri]
MTADTPEPLPRAEGGEAARRRLLRTLLAQHDASTPVRNKAVGDGRDPDATPLSSAQYRMWFHQHARPDSAAYNLAVAAELTGPLDTASLEAAFSTVAGRHEILRTVYRAGPDGTPVQQVLADSEVPLAVDDLTDRAADAEARVRAARAAAAADAARPFDPAVDTPLRLHLYRLAPDHHLLAVVLHHVACDDLSWRPLFTEVSAAYRAAADGSTPSLAPLPFQYGDHAYEEDRAGTEPDEGLDYWRDRLTPPPAPAAPLADLPRPPVPGEAGARATRPLAAGVHDRLTELGRAESATAYMALLTGYVTLLHRPYRHHGRHPGDQSRRARTARSRRQLRQQHRPADRRRRPARLP